MNQANRADTPTQNARNTPPSTTSEGPVDPNPGAPAARPAYAQPTKSAPPTPFNRSQPASPSEPAPSRRAANREFRPEPGETKMAHWILLAAIVVLAIGLRLKDPMSSPLIGAEDPYRHMERTWDLAQGKGFAEYPPGLNLLLLPFTFLGPSAFYAVSMYLPVLFGAAMVVGMFLLCRAYLHPSGGLVAAALVAVMPEAIRRTNLLFPTALDLAILPFLFLAVLRLSEGNRKAMLPVGILSGFILIAHPWVFALLVPPLVVFGLVVAWRERPAWRKAVLGVAAAMGALALVVAVAFTRLFEIMAAPGELTTLPAFVDLPAMLTLPAIMLGALGIFFAARRRDRFSLLALLWTAMLLPLVLVDWLGMWYVPHRTVAYMALGIAMLGAIPVAELLRILKDARPKAQPSATFGSLALALLVMTPTGLGVEPWYRTFTEDELEAWHDLADMDVPYVMAGSWEARAGYRAVTARDANYNPAFFASDFDRQLELRDHPGLVVLIDCHTAAEGNPTDFLHQGGWVLIREWGDASCPKEPITQLPYGWAAAYRQG